MWGAVSQGTQLRCCTIQPRCCTIQPRCGTIQPRGGTIPGEPVVGSQRRRRRSSCSHLSACPPASEGWQAAAAGWLAPFLSHVSGWLAAADLAPAPLGRGGAEEPLPAAGTRAVGQAACRLVAASPRRPWGAGCMPAPPPRHPPPTSGMPDWHWHPLVRPGVAAHEPPPPPARGMPDAAPSSSPPAAAARSGGACHSGCGRGPAARAGRLLAGWAGLGWAGRGGMWVTRAAQQSPLPLPGRSPAMGWRDPPRASSLWAGWGAALPALAPQQLSSLWAGCGAGASTRALAAAGWARRAAALLAHLC